MRYVFDSSTNASLARRPSKATGRDEITAAAARLLNASRACSCSAMLRGLRIEACMLRKPRAERHFIGDENVGAGSFDGAANGIPCRPGRLQSFGPLYIRNAGSCHDEAVDITKRGYWDARKCSTRKSMNARMRAG